MNLHKFFIDKINEEIYKALGVSDSLFVSTSATTTNNCAVSIEEIKLALENVRPEHAVLLSNYAPHGTDIFEIENPLPDKYFCKKLLLLNADCYESLLKKILEEYNCDIKVYR
jgi:hypothetical protein